MDLEQQNFLLEHGAAAFSDDDSAFGDVEFAEVIPVPADHYEYAYRHGRTYSSQYEYYPWPVDKLELERQEEQFHLLYQLYDARLQHAPVVEPARVLDIGAGVGSWATEFADRHPSSEVVGIDLVPIQTVWVPPNCEFFVDDFTTNNWSSSYHDINFIHIGWWNGNDNAFGNFLKEIYHSCARGGCIEITGITIEIFDGCRNSVFSNFYARLREAYKKTNGSFEMPPSCHQVLEAQGFVNVTEHAYNIPLGSQHTDGLHHRIIENWIAGLEAYALEVMVKTMGVSGLEVLLLCAATRKELRENRPCGYLKRRVIYGQKPGALA